MAGRFRLIISLTLLLVPPLLLSGCGDSSLVEIYTPTTAPAPFASVAIEGAVTLPGIYPVKAGDTLEDLLQAAGGQTGSNTSVKLIVGGVSNAPQKININTAEAWLLEALPGIGAVKAAAIIDYRTAHGPFVNILELVKVPGFGQSTYDSLKDLITVSG
ncbi:competence protein ComEA [Dehalogenimonas formicexedens]|uniref:Competence protein ComEA n=1 Tax=Dehalogenimonas formicexedens TaxID=1839801 RepID=A0A1P8F4P1_9CHLR|nr:ComEA family DNA-binding protein [Dehalogenimonas formicexedens]APV43415.1 competence protein ComEA [Dehalogenimonas formicexedens]